MIFCCYCRNINKTSSSSLEPLRRAIDCSNRALTKRALSIVQTSQSWLGRNCFCMGAAKIMLVFLSFSFILFFHIMPCDSDYKVSSSFLLNKITFINLNYFYGAWFCEFCALYTPKWTACLNTGRKDLYEIKLKI